MPNRHFVSSGIAKILSIWFKVLELADGRVFSKPTAPFGLASCVSSIRNYESADIP